MPGRIIWPDCTFRGEVVVAVFGGGEQAEKKKKRVHGKDSRLAKITSTAGAAA